MAGYAGVKAPTAEESEEVVIEELEGKSHFQASQEYKKDMSYYYAHIPEDQKGFPEGATIRKDDPLTKADGLGPKQVELKKKMDFDNVRWVDNMAWTDDGKVVKVYIDFPEDLKGAEVTCEWERFGVEMLVKLPNDRIYGVRVRDAEGWILEHERKNGFTHEIVPEKCKHRVSSSGPKISLTLTKKDEGEKWYELKKKDIRSTF